MLTFMYTFIILLLFLQHEISGVNGNVGYRQMWRIMQVKYNYCVKRYYDYFCYTVTILYLANGT